MAAVQKGPLPADVYAEAKRRLEAGERPVRVVTGLSGEELARVEEFLAPPLIAVVATIGGAGMPQLTPNWYVYQDGRVAVSTTKERVKYKNLVRDPRLVCVYSDMEATEYVTIRGPVEIYDDDSIWPVQVWVRLFER